MVDRREPCHDSSVNHLFLEQINQQTCNQSPGSRMISYILICTMTGIKLYIAAEILITRNMTVR